MIKFLAAFLAIFVCSYDSLAVQPLEQTSAQDSLQCVTNDHEALQFLKSIGAFLEPESVTHIEQVKEINLIGKCLGDQIFRYTCRATNLEALTIANDHCSEDKKITGRGFELLKYTTKIKSLDLDSNLVKRDYFEDLNVLSQLSVLKLEDNSLTSMDLPSLAKVRVNGSLVLARNNLEGPDKSKLAYFLDHSKANSLIFSGVQNRNEFEAAILMTKGNPNLESLHFFMTLDVQVASHLIDVNQLKKLSVVKLDGVLRKSNGFTEANLKNIELDFTVATASLLKQFTENTSIQIYHFDQFQFDDQKQAADFVNVIASSKIHRVYLKGTMDVDYLATLISNAPQTQFYFELGKVVEKKGKAPARTMAEYNLRKSLMKERLLDVCSPNQCHVLGTLTGVNTPLNRHED